MQVTMLSENSGRDHLEMSEQEHALCCRINHIDFSAAALACSIMPRAFPRPFGCETKMILNGTATMHTATVTAIATAIVATTDIVTITDTAIVTVTDTATAAAVTTAAATARASVIAATSATTSVATTAIFSLTKAGSLHEFCIREL